MIDRETISVYDTQADAYAGKTDAYNADDPRLIAFIAACPPGGRVLDLGCGPGACAATMVRAGLSVEAVDTSDEMVARAGRLTGVNARKATFDDIDGSAVYDGVWANFSLLHAPRDAFPRHLSAIHHALKPGGTLMIGMKLGTGEGRDRIGRFYTYYAAEDLERHLTDAGFTLRSRAFGSGTGLDGAVSDWISVAAHA